MLKDIKLYILFVVYNMHNPNIFVDSFRNENNENKHALKICLIKRRN